jgi:hypothetical protein
MAIVMWLSFIKLADPRLAFRMVFILFSGLKVSNIRLKSNGGIGIFWKL